MYNGKTTFITNDPEADLQELSNILLNLRYHSKKWHQHFGQPNRRNMERWEAKADEWLANHTKPKTEEEEE